VLHAMVVALLLVVITMAFGVAFYGSDVPGGTDLLRFVATLLVGGASFAALGLALTSIIPNADASPAIVNASILPLLFLSGIFIPLGNHPPTWIAVIGDIFPVKHFADAMQAGFLGETIAKAAARTPELAVSPFSWSDVAVVAAWGLAGLAISARYFSWEPRR
jgi:ABC-2 type transport system permease protein